MIALLRGINVSGQKKVPMAELRALATGLGFGDVQTYIQSGNLVFTTQQSAAAAEDVLEAALLKHFGFPVDVIVRTRAQWQVYAAGSPFPAAQADHANLVLLGLSKRPPNADAVEMLNKYMVFGERAVLMGDALWIDFPGGSGRSKITPGVMDRALGSPVTTRNWRTVQTLAGLVGLPIRPEGEPAGDPASDE